MLQIEPLADDLPFGAVIRRLDFAAIADPDVQQALREAWNRAGLLHFADGEVSKEFHLALSRVFDRLEVHKTREYLDQSTPELVTLTTTGETELDVDGQIGEVFGWHRDLIYTDRINRGGILRSLKPSERGGLTGFLDSADAYDRLPAKLKEVVSGLRVIYQIGSPEEFPRSTTSQVKLIRRSDAVASIIERRDRDFPPVSHPLVFDHPENGRRVLNFSPFFARSVEGMDSREGDALLDALSEHLLSCPSYHHKWSRDEFLMWDNWRVLHMVGFTPLGEERVMQRTTIAGDYGLGSHVFAPAGAPAA